MGHRFLSSAGVGKSSVLPTQVPNPSPTLDKNLAWVQEFHPVLGLGSGGRLLRHFQTPTLHWIHLSATVGETSLRAQKKLEFDQFWPLFCGSPEPYFDPILPFVRGLGIPVGLPPPMHPKVDWTKMRRLKLKGSLHNSHVTCTLKVSFRCHERRRPFQINILGELFSASLHKTMQRGPGHYMENFSAKQSWNNLGGRCSRTWI